MIKGITDGKTKIGAYRLSIRKKPCLCVEQGNNIIVYGTFIDEKAAKDFIDRLADLVGAEDSEVQNG